jgi:hypothetical protein
VEFLDFQKMLLRHLGHETGAGEPTKANGKASA